MLRSVGVQRKGEYYPKIKDCLLPLDIRSEQWERLPFSIGDTTVGSETELQVAVCGEPDTVDLPLTIKASSYYQNIIRRAEAGDTSKTALSKLKRYLSQEGLSSWENSWVRFPVGLLSNYARKVLEEDLRADDSTRPGNLRSDADRFFVESTGGKTLRIPISYLIKLALADAFQSLSVTPASLQKVAEGLMKHFLSDNTSPETSSFHIVDLCHSKGNGDAVAREAARRYLLIQLLVAYANKKFRLEESGQKAMVFLSPHPPIRQKLLNACISDAYYRELFMSPCLNWKNGEAKHRYMNLCHEVLSRSQLNAVGKLREAGIITRNLVVLPNTSNISLANNGVHISIGSRKLTALLSDPSSGFDPTHEKYLGDLVIKIVEHFLSLFVGTYSAAPYRLSFPEFHPELVLGFLPHELDYTHLRMLWRRWKKKAKIKVLKRSVTPFGPELMDNFISRIFHLRGDFISDFRLLDYPVSLLSTKSSPALNGILGNDERLKKDLASMGVFDPRMSLYLMYKLREFSRLGFSGFEARSFSLFESFQNDLSRAVELQNLLTALAFKLIISWNLSHNEIPDSPFVESERRQVLFASAIGIPTFYVSKRTGNRFLRTILSRTQKTRSSRRYPGYNRVIIREYHKVLISILEEEGCELMEILGLERTLEDLKQRIEANSRVSASAKITRGIADKTGKSSPLMQDSADFNGAAESYYRDELRIQHIQEGFDYFKRDVSRVAVDSMADPSFRKLLSELIPASDVDQFLNQQKRAFLNESSSVEDLRKLIQLFLLTEQKQSPGSTIRKIN